jgi:hypothetical protein
MIHTSYDTYPKYLDYLLAWSDMHQSACDTLDCAFHVRIAVAVAA